MLLCELAKGIGSSRPCGWIALTAHNRYSNVNSFILPHIPNNTQLPTVPISKSSHHIFSISSKLLFSESGQKKKAATPAPAISKEATR